MYEFNLFIFYLQPKFVEPHPAILIHNYNNCVKAYITSIVLLS